MKAYTEGISPKVYVPVLAGALILTASWLLSGNFDQEEATVLVLTFLYGVLGVAVSPGNVKLY